MDICKGCNSHVEESMRDRRAKRQNQ